MLLKATPIEFNALFIYNLSGGAAGARTIWFCSFFASKNEQSFPQ
jgi:hypothetical protein